MQKLPQKQREVTWPLQNCLLTLWSACYCTTYIMHTHFCSYLVKPMFSFCMPSLPVLWNLIEPLWCPLEDFPLLSFWWKSGWGCGSFLLSFSLCCAKGPLRSSWASLMWKDSLLNEIQTNRVGGTGLLQTNGVRDWCATVKRHEERCLPDYSGTRKEGWVILIEMTGPWQEAGEGRAMDRQMLLLICKQHQRVDGTIAPSSYQADAMKWYPLGILVKAGNWELLPNCSMPKLVLFLWASVLG